MSYNKIMHEANRKRAIELHKKGIPSPIIAQRLGTSSDFVTSSIRKFKKEQANDVRGHSESATCQ